MAAVTAEGKKGEEKMRNKPFYFKLRGFLFGFLLLFSVFMPITQVQSQTQNINLNGLWKSSFGSTVGISQAGGVIKGTIKESKTSSRIGTTDMTGSFDGSGSIKGEVYLRANNRSCSFLDGYFPATGTVSPDSNTITFTWENHIYNDDTCDFTGEIRQGTLTYTKIIPQNSPTPNPTAVPTITLQPTVPSQTGENSPTGIDIPGYTQALVDKPPKASDFQNIPQSDFRIVYPTGKTPATQKLATESANIKDSIFIGKVGDTGEVVVESPNGEKITLTDDMSGIDFFNKRFGVTLPGPEMGNPTQVKIVEVDCHIIASRNDSGNCDSTGRCIYPDIWDAQTRIEKTVGDCTYLSGGGPVRVLAEQGQVTLKTPGGVTVTASKADFGIAYDAKSGTSVVEIYNGSVKVSNKSGQAKTISTVYGSQIKRLEVDQNGEMTEKIAIPLSEWEAFLASQQEKEIVSRGNLLPIAFAITLLGAGGIIFFLYRKGKLIPLYKTLSQKISGVTKKISKNNKQQDSV